MNWIKITTELRTRLNLREISEMTGMSKGSVHDLCTGRRQTVAYETGVVLVALHRRMMRRKPRVA